MSDEELSHMAASFVMMYVAEDARLEIVRSEDFKEALVKGFYAGFKIGHATLQRETIQMGSN